MADDTGPGDRRRGLGGDAGLLLTAFVASLALLFGLGLLVGDRPSTPGSGDPGASPRPAGTAAAGSPGSAGPSFGTVAPTPLADPVLVGAGDIADCDRPGAAATAALLDDIPGTVFTAGDHAYPDGSLGAFRECYGPTWGRHRERTRPAAGNHDWEVDDAAGYREYFGDAVGPDGRTWYAYDLGAWHVIVLDSTCDAVGGCDAASEQGRWLAADLAASRARCTIAIWHHPRWSSGEHGSDRRTDPFWQALHAAGVEVVVNGHDHDYERFAPQDPAGVEDRDGGIRQFVVGTGGAELRRFTSIAPNSELRASIGHGVLRLDLHPTSYEWHFVSVAGQTFSDSGSTFCH